MNNYNSANQFGKLSADYKIARRGYPVEVYDYLNTTCDKKDAVVLDLGCGTGISTRELKAHGFNVIGADADERMVETAKAESDDIAYFVQKADNLSFENSRFDIVTAFTAFHWFNNPESIGEIKRVVKEEGLFFVALKGNQQSDETKQFNLGFKAILKKYAGADFDATSKHFDADNLKAFFSNIIEKSFVYDEVYTIEEALALLRSSSIWNRVAETRKQEMLDETREFYLNQFSDGTVVRKREVFTIMAWKK